jgi:toxin ParE1/3/4
MAKLNWTLEALDWLEDIHAYIAQDNPGAAARVIDGIVEKAELLRSHPAIGTRLRVVPEGEVRMLLYGHYRIAYLLRAGADVIDILGVFHGALDIDRYLP